MVRTFLYLIIAIFLITFIRAAIGLIGKGVAELFQPDVPDKARGGAPPEGGELRQDPVCGIYVSTATRVRKTIDGRDFYFCSESCRDKFRA
ncbi:MAG: YHS domain-containing protein [Bryobacteraceae bacterium]|nr:YHS domain-containing protein [Bryobacteraceae bacterium]